jgi:hypothetical protein
MYKITVDMSRVTAVSPVESLQSCGHIEGASFGEFAELLRVQHLPPKAIVICKRRLPPIWLGGAIQESPLNAQPCLVVDRCRDFS